jgi:hypothetical protein
MFVVNLFLDPFGRPIPACRSEGRRGQERKKIDVLIAVDMLMSPTKEKTSRTWIKMRLPTRRDILAKMRHGGLAAKAELLTGIEDVSSRPVRKILLLG